jgi:hypothetical protein
MTFHPKRFIGCLAVVICTLTGAAQAVAVAKRQAAISCSSIPLPTLEGAKTLSISTASAYNVTGKASLGGTAVSESFTDLSYCAINVTYTHPGINDTVQVEYLLPLSGWNGRFQSTGGGGFSAGSGQTGMLTAVAAGFAAGTTNIQAFMELGHPNQGLFTDFSGRALHEMTVVGKELCASFYGSPPHHTYWAGCSTGGRQGHQMAQRYPEDFDGVLANSPAIMWTPLMMTLEWTVITMVQHNHFLTPCEIDIFLNESINLCDPLDGVVDRIISHPGACAFNPNSLVGRNYTCDGRSITIGQTAADVTQSIHDGIVSPLGRKLWTGYDWGTNWTGILAPNITATGSFGYFGVNWISTFLAENANYNSSAVTTEQLLEWWIDSTNRYGGVIDTSDPDLTPFRNRGGKLMTFHGFADYAIPANNTMFYRNLVESSMGGYDATNEFYRLFFAPGVGHCGAGYGPAPVDALDKLVAWVEQGVPPTSLLGSYVTLNGTTATRPLCVWPQVAKYIGGHQDNAASFQCSSDF